MPINFDFLNVSVLKRALTALAATDANVAASDNLNREEVITQLTNLDPLQVQHVLSQLLSFQPTAPPTVSTPQGISNIVAGKTVKLPPFYPQDTKVWFDLAEQVMEDECRTDQQRRLSVLRALNPEIIKTIGLDATWSYGQLKDHILKHYGDSEEQKLRKLLQGITLGDRKPSACLREIVGLAQGNENLARLKFTEILPDYISVNLAGLSSISLEEMALMADRMMEQFEVCQSKGNISQVRVAGCASSSTQNSESPLDLMMKQHILLQQQVTQLASTVNALRFSESQGDSNTHQRRHSGNFKPVRNRSKSRDRKLCYKHATFGRRAWSCGGNGCTWNDRFPQEENDEASAERRHLLK